MDEKIAIKRRYDIFAESLNHDFDKIINLHINITPVAKYFRRRKIEVAMQLGKFKKGDRILEIGSNMGQNTILLAEKGLQMLGVDLSDKAVEVARENARALNFINVDYLPMDAEDLSFFKEGTFDGVVSFSTLRYLNNLKKALNEIYRVTKKNGVVVLDFPNKYCPWFTLLKNKFGVEDHICDHFYTGKELRKIFSSAGFRNIEIKKIMFTHYTFPEVFLGLYKIIDFIGEKFPLVKETAAIIFCKGVKN